MKKEELLKQGELELPNVQNQDENGSADFESEEEKFDRHVVKENARTLTPFKETNVQNSRQVLQKEGTASSMTIHEDLKFEKISVQNSPKSSQKNKLIDGLPNMGD